MRRHDRLAWLGACHGILQHCRIRSLDAYRAAPPERLAGLHVFRATIRELVAAGHPDVMLALWPPGELHWSVARLTIDPSARVLSVNHGPVGKAGSERLRLKYDVRNADAEREAWRALLGALRGARSVGKSRLAIVEARDQTGTRPSPRARLETTYAGVLPTKPVAIAE